MGKQAKDLCKVISACVKRGELTRQQGKTLMGQCKHGDIEGAKKGLERLMRTGEKQSVCL